MQYSNEVEQMCCVKKGPNHGPSPIPEEGKWIQAKEIGDIKLGNTVMLGAIADYLPFSAEVLLQEILQRFANKGEAVLEKNKTAFEKGRQAVK